MAISPTAPVPPSIIPCPVLGELVAGTLQVCIAREQHEIEAAQALRYQVFVAEKGAHVSAAMQEAKRDWDDFDPFCDHLLVLEHASGRPRVVGTYRLLRREGMRKHGSFYTASEFNIQVIETYPGEVMELGRSCVDANYRNRAVMQLLWRGIGAYVARYQIEIMFGCASLHGVEIDEHIESLAYLHHYHLAPPELQLKALPQHYVNMNLMPKTALNAKAAFVALPALVKGYLRLGGYVSDGAVVDYEYNTIDVGVVVKTDLVTGKYVQRYGQETPSI